MSEHSTKAGIMICALIILACGCEKAVSECEIDEDCGYLPHDCGVGYIDAGVCPPRWAAFCVDGWCKLSKNPNLSKSRQWIETCDVHKAQDMSMHNLQECYFFAAFAALKESSQATNNTPDVFLESFSICELITGGYSEMCKQKICRHLENREARVECHRQSREFTNCSDGYKNAGETDIDCGGDCTPCEIGQHCRHNLDCSTNNCTRFECVE